MEMLASVIQVNDLDGARQVLVGEVPDLRRAVSDDDHLVDVLQTAPTCLGVDQ